MQYVVCFCKNGQHKLDIHNNKIIDNNTEIVPQ